MHGLLLLDKPAGITSHDLVGRVRKILNLKSVGHCGTLDPMATGLMILLVGEATKVSNYLLEQDKAYRVRAQLGLRTDTLDLTGQVLEKKAVDLDASKVSEEVLALSGEFEWPVPIFSAVKVDGEKLYEKARRQEQVETPMKRMRFDQIQVLEQGPDWVEAHLHCSKGAYIRSWVDVLGQRLGVGAAMSSLRRTQSRPFKLEHAITLDRFAQTWAETQRFESLGPSFVPLASSLPHWKTLRVSGVDQSLIRNGQISHGLRSMLIATFQPGVDEGVKIVSKSEDELLALIGLEPGQGFLIRRVFRY